MKLRDKIIAGCLIILLILLHRYLFQLKEGFFNDSANYARLKKRIINELEPYCKIDSFVRDQLKTMVTSSGGSGDNASLNKVYTDVYSCSDPDANSRPSCLKLGGMGPNQSMIYVSSDNYKELPEWSNDGSVSIALMKISNDLPERLIRESEWFAAIIKKLQESLAAGANPPGVSSIDGFTGTCSADAARAKKLMDEAKSCSIPDATSEIARVNTLLDSPKLKQALSKMNGLLAAMLKLQSDLEKAKNGTLYDWQKDPPKKSYPEFKGGDRSAALTFSMQQNK
jgi:hypothetical protein